MTNQPKMAPNAPANGPVPRVNEPPIETKRDAPAPTPAEAPVETKKI